MKISLLKNRIGWLMLPAFFSVFTLHAQVDKSDWEANYPDGCTSVTVGKKASDDGSVRTSHTDDSHRTRSNILVSPAKDYKPGAMMPVYKRVACDTSVMPSYMDIKVGEIPQVTHTYAYINSAYACLNEHQLAIGESTFGGREILQSDSGIIDCQRLCILMLERCKTAREAITFAGELMEKYGWNDAGECLTIADTKEVWHLEIVGPGKGKRGAIWVAQRVPDEHISVNANASTIKEIDLRNKDFFMASKNIFSVAQENNWWKPENGAFRFCYAYAPESRAAVGSRRREWRVFDLVAPSLKLDPNSENYPFSVKPEKPLTLQKMADIFKDYYEGTDFDMTKNMTVTDKNGKTIISPLANPQMPYDANLLHKINGGWGWRGERTIARWYTMYATIIQCRDWLPDPIGGVVWMAMDNVQTSVYVPIYCSVTDLPESYKTDGRRTGFSRKSAWWAFNYQGTLAMQRWGDMRKDVEKVWNPWQARLFEDQKRIETEALKLYDPRSPQKTISFLTKYTMNEGSKAVEKAWEFGDFLFTKYDELW